MARSPPLRHTPPSIPGRQLPVQLRWLIQLSTCFSSDCCDSRWHRQNFIFQPFPSLLSQGFTHYGSQVKPELPGFLYKVLRERQTHALVSTSFTVALGPQPQSWPVTTVTVQLRKSKIFTLWPLTEKAVSSFLNQIPLYDFQWRDSTSLISTS